MMRRGIKKVEMVDAWTQTSNRGSDTEEQKKQKKQSAPGNAHHRNASNGAFIGSDHKNLPRSSVENIYNS